MQLKAFVKILVDTTTISPAGSHFAVSTFGTSIGSVSTFANATLQDPAELKTAIDAVNYGDQRATDIGQCIITFCVETCKYLQSISSCEKPVGYSAWSSRCSGGAVDHRRPVSGLFRLRVQFAEIMLATMICQGRRRFVPLVTPCTRSASAMGRRAFPSPTCWPTQAAATIACGLMRISHPVRPRSRQLLCRRSTTHSLVIQHRDKFARPLC